MLYYNYYIDRASRRTDSRPRRKPEAEAPEPTAIYNNCNIKKFFI